MTGRVLIAMTSLSTLALGCQPKPGFDDREVDYSLVRIARDKATLRHDTVGHDKWESQATFVLIDAHNLHDKDLIVSLGGDLVDGQGAPVGKVRTESLRIPAGGVRTFAMIDREQQVRDAATSARIEVLGAFVPNYPPLVQVTDGAAYRYDSERIVVNGVVRNAVDRPTRVIVLAGFYDADDRPLTRPFTEMFLPGDGHSNAQFPGPPGAVKGYIFIGPMVY